MKRTQQFDLRVVSAPQLQLSVQGRLRRYALLSGMGIVIASALDAPVVQAAAPFGSPAWFAQARAASPVTATAGTAANPPSAGAPGAVVTPQQAILQAQRSTTDLARAAAAVTSALAAQKAAQQLSLGAPSNVPDGLAAGGLQVANGVGSNPSLWQNAKAPTQSVAAGKTTVNVKQTAQKAILTWDSFNVGRNTTLNYDQSAGTQANGSNDWIALNRISAGGSPSQILGQIKADGSIYLINPSGIIFGAGSQVNVHSLIASSLPLFNDSVAASNAFFLNQGIANAVGSQPILGGALTPQLVASPAASAQITIEAGASITTGELGYSLIAAPKIVNAGSITASGGQAILAAGLRVSQQQVASSSNSASSALLVPVVTGTIVDSNGHDITPVGSIVNTGIIQSPRGNISLVGGNIQQNGVLAASSSVTTPGSITIDARDERDVVSALTQARVGSVKFGPTSVTTLLPEEDGQTTTSTASADQTFQTGTIKITGGSVSLNSGALIEAPGQNVQITAIAENLPGQTFSGITDGSVVGRVYVDQNATIDVAGLANIELAMAVNQVTIPRLGLNELADSPLQRNGFLFGQPITVDASAVGVDANGNAYVGTPLANVGGYIQQVPRKIDQLLQNGGAITLAGGEVLTRTGSQLNLDGGYIHYLGGLLTTTKLVAANGAIIDISNADPNVSYIGIAGQFTQAQPRFNLTRSYSNPLLAGGAQYVSDYIQGGKAGTLNVFGLSTTILDGDVSAHAYAGRNQVAGGAIPAGGQYNAGAGSNNKLASAVFPDIDTVLLAGPSYVLEKSSPELKLIDADFSFDTPLTSSVSALNDPDNFLKWTPISTDLLRDGGFSGISVMADDPARTRKDQGGEILVRNAVDVQAGGSISLTGSRVRIRADLNAESGSINVTATGNTSVVGSTLRPTEADSATRDGDLIVANGVTLDARGQWVNDAGLDQDHIRGGAYINGGSISLQTLQNAFQIDGTQVVDTTGSVQLGSGSLLDVSSGARILPSGKFSIANDVLKGRGGNLSLAVYAPNAAGPFGAEPPSAPLPTAMPNSGQLQLDGNLRGYGFSGGGSLSLRALGIQIGDSAAAAPSWALVLPANFFSAQGFGKYVLTAEYDATITAGTVVAPSQVNLIPNVAALLSAASGSDILPMIDSSSSGASSVTGGLTSLGKLDDYHRQAAGFSLFAGDYLNWRSNSGLPDYSGSPSIAGAPGITGTVLLAQNASINADAGAQVLLGSINQVTVEGSIIARGGSITLTGDTGGGGYSQVPGVFSTASYTSNSKSVWLGSSSLLDVSGIALIDPLATPVSVDGSLVTPRTGRLLAGGQVVLTDDTGYVIALNCSSVNACGADGVPGARIRADGASAEFDLPSAAGGYTRQTIYSDAGSITVGAGAGLFFNARLSAQAPSSSTAAGGSLTIAPESNLPFPPGAGFDGATQMVVRENLQALPTGALTPGATIDAKGPVGVIGFGASELNNSGIETLNLGSDPALRSAAIPLLFGSNVSLKLDRAITINASVITGASPAAAADGSAGTSVVTLDAPYVALHGYTPGANYAALPTPKLPDANVSLVVQADNIDLGGQFELRNFGSASFNANGDIRFVTPAADEFYTPNSTSAPITIPGLLLSGGDLTFDAVQIYPATGNRFIIDAVAITDPDTGNNQATKITFARNPGKQNASPPISAGGSLLVDASNIVQNGVLLAPDGQITLGVNDIHDGDTRDAYSYPNTDLSNTQRTVQLPLTVTGSVQLGERSITSVSLSNTIVPYGETVDGQNWQYNGAALINAASGSQVPDLTAPPIKQVTLSARNVSVKQGASVDLSGGGDLQAQEFVPGTGGSRDVLSQYQTSYASGSSQQVPTYGDARPVYAIIPGYHGIAPYDPAIVGGAPLVGQSVYLSGVPGLPAGVYTLMPAKYATLPGAFRVVENTAATDAVASQNQTLADGTQLVAGRFVDGITGSESSRSTAFFVQSNAVWQQYSQYTLSSANTYFAALAASKGEAAPLLPQDAGHLVLAATKTLSLGGTVNAAAANGGTGAEVDIAAPQIQISGSGAVALDGYVQVSATDLDDLKASSLLIGGTSTRTGEGQQIKVLATSVVVDNGSQALSAPEITLVANAVDGAGGITVNAGSVIKADGTLSAGNDVPVIIGQLPSSTGAKDGASGDGALLRVSNGAATTVTRRNVPGVDGASGSAAGVLTIGAGANISGGVALTLDASGNTVVDPTALFSAKEIDADSSLITFVGSGGSTAPIAGLVISPQLLQQFAAAQTINLSSRGDLAFNGAVDIALSNALSLNAERFVGDGHAVSIKAGTLTLGNSIGGDPAAATAGSGGALSLHADEIVIGGGDKALAGFGSVNATATKGMLLQGKGAFDFGAAALSLNTPILIADAGADASLRTAAALNIASASGGKPLTLMPIGGAMHLTGASVAVATSLQALGGTIGLDATTGDVSLASTAALDVSGIAKQFFDVTRYAAGGSIKLRSELGNVQQASGAKLEFGGATGGGDAGSLGVIATQGAAQLGGTLSGAAANGYSGGAFTLDTLAATDLDALAHQLADGGVDRAVAVHTRSGNLQLSAGNTLSAEQVSLTADGGSGAPSAIQGNVNVLGTIDASGAAGGSIALFGRSGVDLEGTLRARANDASQRGGNVDIGTLGISDGTVDASYGYENVSAANAGTLRFGSGAQIDVSGGTLDGSVHLRAPLLAGGELNVAVAAPATLVKGARETTLEAFATWSTDDASLGAKHFDGIIDPAGLYDAQGQSVDPVNAEHSGFYQTTLLGFVQQPGFSFGNRYNAIKGLVVRPGIDLVNNDAAINSGNISVLSNWNLGAGTLSGGLPVLSYRYAGSIAPVLSLRAASDINVDASISDGFFQYSNPFGPNANGACDAVVCDNSIAPQATKKDPLPLLTASLDGATTGFDANGKPFVLAADSTSYRLVAGADTASADPLALSNAAYQAGRGNVSLDGHTVATYIKNVNTGASVQVVAPTMIRTGVGSIDIAAANNVQLLDTVAPGVIYTAGRPSANTTAEDTSRIVKSIGKIPVIVDSGQVNPDSAGDISIVAGNDIIGVEQITDDGSRSGKAGTNLSQFWWPWMQQDCVFIGNGCAAPTSSSINFGNFDQGVLSVGGNVSVSAGNDIRDLGVSLPTTWTLTTRSDGGQLVNTIGGGNRLTVSAGGNILSGTYFVAQGQGQLSAGGDIASDIVGKVGSVATLLAVQDAQLSVNARGSIDIGGVFDPSYLFQNFDSQSYSAASAVNLSATAGDVAFNTLTNRTGEYGYGSNLVSAYSYLLPAALNVTALNGDIQIQQRGELYPSAIGNLRLIAAGNTELFDTLKFGNLAYFGLIDAPDTVLPSPLNPLGSSGFVPTFINNGGISNLLLHTDTLLHAADPEPVRIYSLVGDLVDGTSSGRDMLIVAADKPAQIIAGRDIVNLDFRGQNLYASDISLISAGRDIYDTALSESQQLAAIQLGGIGTLALSAGRNIGPITSANEAFDAGFLPNGTTLYPGIDTVGNLYNAHLEHAGADIAISFGIAPGVDLQSFEQAYLDPSVTAVGLPSYSTQLIRFVQQYENDDLMRHGLSGKVGKLSAAQAYAAFGKLPAVQQQLLVSSVFFDILNRTGIDFNKPDSLYAGQYGRGYQAISTLFPSALGYTANNLGSGSNGAQAPVATGLFDMRGSTVQTQQGGDVSVLGPGGEVLVGSTAAPPSVAATPSSAGIGPNDQGILTLEQGSVSIFTDRSVLLAQSRIFTEQGGDVLIWSSNGDVNAGKGAKTVSEIPPPDYLCDLDHYCVVDAKSQVSGAGIAVLQTKAGAASGNANLVAPRGTVDAGEAGIRVSGNLNVAALHIANANNIQVQGNKAGVPTGLVNTGALNLASSVAAAVSQNATALASSRPQDSAVNAISVEVIGFGTPSADQQNELRQ